MGPVPEDNHNPADRDLPNHDSDHEDLETPNHVIPAAAAGGHSSSDEDDDDMDSEGEGPASHGYMLLPQEPDEGEEEEGGGGGGEGIPHPHAFPPLSALEGGEGGSLSTGGSMTEVRGAGVDLTQAIAEGSVHPAFAASFPDNKVPVHLQVPDLPKTIKDDVLWNQSTSQSDRLQLDSAQLSKVRSAMVGFQLPTASIPEWARQVPEQQWKQQLVDRLSRGRPAVGGVPLVTSTSRPSPPPSSSAPPSSSCPSPPPSSSSSSSSGGPGQPSSEAPAAETVEGVGNADCQQAEASSST